jgi:hypothetical protein
VVTICHLRQANHEAKEECTEDKKKSNGKKIIPIASSHIAKRRAHSVNYTKFFLSISLPAARCILPAESGLAPCALRLRPYALYLFNNPIFQIMFGPHRNRIADIIPRIQPTPIGGL